VTILDGFVACQAAVFTTSPSYGDAQENSLVSKRQRWLIKSLRCLPVFVHFSEKCCFQQCSVIGLQMGYKYARGFLGERFSFFGKQKKCRFQQ
jgi:hypothetical protein